MQPFGDNFILVIPLEDEKLHTHETSFCLDPACPCHQEEDFIVTIHILVDEGLVTPSEAERIIRGEAL